MMIILISGYASNIFPKTDAAYTKRIALAKKFIIKDKGQQALNILKPMLINNKSYDVYILTAQAYAEIDDPRKARSYYNCALKIAKNMDEKRLAYFGIAKMQFWLSNYVHAECVYRLILTTTKPNKEDYELALAGLVKSLAYYDRPRCGYRMIPCHLKFTKPEMVVAAGQAALWSDWGDITKCILERYQPIVAKISRASTLGKDLQDLQWQTDLATWPNIISPTFYYSVDSDSFIKKYSTLDYTHYWNQVYQTSLGFDHIIYTQSGSNKLIARGIYASQTYRRTRCLILKGRLEPMSYNSWHPLLWRGGADYRPNDNFYLQLLANKEVVETFPAFINKVSDNQYSLSLTLRPFPYIVFNGAYNRLNFSDNNFRNGYYLSSTATLLNDLGLSATVIVRGFSDKHKSPNYFSPYRYRTGTFILRLGRKWGATWHYYLDGGRGKQYIIASRGDPTATSPTHQFGFGINGPITNCLFVTAYYADLFQASAFRNSSNYHYQYGAITFNILI